MVFPEICSHGCIIFLLSWQQKSPFLVFNVVYVANQFSDFNWLFIGSKYSNTYSKCLIIVKISDYLIIKFEFNYGIRILIWYLWEEDIKFDNGKIV